MPSTTLSQRREPHKLIENRISFAGPDSELSIYDTYQSASRVGLDAGELLYCGMIHGRKIMHAAEQEAEQVFLPHESFIMAPGEHVEIDFPDASLNAPTTCLTIEIAREKVERIAERLSDICTGGMQAWQGGASVLHTHHTTETQSLLKRLTTLFTENHPDRDVMVELGVSELIIRMLRQQGREFLLNYSRQVPDACGISTALAFLEKNLAQPLDIDELSRLACMSRSRLYVEFKNQLGCTPCEFLLQLRLKSAAKRIRHGDAITRVCYELGFSNPSHFSRRFRDFFGCSPREYRNRFSAQPALQEVALQ